MKEFLSSINVEVEERCVFETPDTLDELRELSGHMAIPVTKIDGDFFVGADKLMQIDGQ